METKIDIAYGVIPYVRTQDGLRFLVVYQYSHVRDDTYWVFPKGHAEESESPEEAARRELCEETGLEVGTLDTKHSFTITYDIELSDRKIAKKVIFFLGEVTHTDLQLQAEEVVDAKWLSYKDARAQLSYENTKTVLDTAVAYLESHQSPHSNTKSDL